MKKRSFGKLIRKDPFEALDYVSSNLRNYSAEDLESAMKEMHLPANVVMKVKNCLANRLIEKKLLIQKENVSLMKTMFSLLQRLKITSVPSNEPNKNFQVKPEFGGGDVFKKKRKPINKQAAQGTRGLSKANLI